jgi:hypothetical protein
VSVPALPPYDRSARCQKCGGGVISVLYVKHEDVMRRSCTTCLHNWNEAPLDRAERLKFEERMERLKKRARTD